MTDRKALSFVFRRARVYLAQRQEHFRWQDRYICYTIDSVQGITLSTKQAAKDIIKQRIAPWNCIEAWLVREAKVISERDFPEIYDQVQQFRHRWLDNLAHEFNQERPE